MKKLHRAVLLPLLIIPVVLTLGGSVAGRARTGVHPVLNDQGLLLGGLVDGLWTGWEEIGRRLSGKEVYRHYSGSAFLAKSRGAKPIQQQFITGQFLYWIDTGKHESGLFSIAGDWNPWPRRATASKRGLEKYASFVKQFLDSHGLKKAAPTVNQAIQGDLDGDGAVETLLAASNVPEITDREMDAITEGKFDERSRCYSVVLLLRKDGSVQVVAKSMGELSEHEIEFVADINGDGITEFLVRELWIESLASEGFSMINDLLFRPVKKGVSRIGRIEYHPFIPGETL